MIACSILAILTCGGMIACVVTGAQIKKIALYWVVTLFGAVLMLATGLAPLSEVGSALVADSSVNPLKILVLFLSMTGISVLLDEAGFFAYLAARTLRTAGNRQMRLFILLYLIVSLLTVVTSNDIVVLTFTPFLCYFCKNARIDPVPYLIGEFVAANTFSMTLLIGNPTNIYLAQSMGVAFSEYFLVMWLPALFGGLTAFLVLFVLFFRKLKTPLRPMPLESTPDKPLTTIGLIHLGVCTLFLVIGEYLSLELWMVALISFTSDMVVSCVYKLCKKQSLSPVGKCAKRMPWTVVPFMLSMFVIVTALKVGGVTEAFSAVLNSPAPIWVYGPVSTLFCNLINNIPMSVLFSGILQSGTTSMGAVYASIVGSNIGAFLTPIGALAGIMWSNILKEQGVKISFARFCLFGVIVAVPTLLASLLGLQIIL